MMAMGIMTGILSAALSGAAAVSFDRYQIILDRKPFGAGTPPTPDASKAAAPNQPALSAVLRLALLKYDDQTGTVEAGIVDTKANRNYFLAVGETEEGLTLVKADFENDQVMVRKDGQEAWLALGVGPKPRESASGTSRLPPAPTNVVRRFMIRTDASGGGSVTELSPGPSMVTNAPPRPWTTREEMREFYRQKNLELIRAGGKLGPPLPIRLTPEEDAMLVAEGVLPPLEPSPHQPPATPKANEVPRRR